MDCTRSFVATTLVCETPFFIVQLAPALDGSDWWRHDREPLNRFARIPQSAFSLSHSSPRFRRVRRWRRDRRSAWMEAKVRHFVSVSAVIARDRRSIARDWLRSLVFHTSAVRNVASNHLRESLCLLRRVIKPCAFATATAHACTPLIGSGWLALVLKAWLDPTRTAAPSDLLAGDKG